MAAVMYSKDQGKTWSLSQQAKGKEDAKFLARRMNRQTREQSRKVITTWYKAVW